MMNLSVDGRARVWMLRGGVVLGLAAVVAMQFVTGQWLTLYVFPEHLFQKYPLRKADGELARWVGWLHIASPLLLAAWFLLARMLWRRAGGVGTTDGRRGRLSQVASGIYWGVVVVFVLSGLGGLALRDLDLQHARSIVEKRMGMCVDDIEELGRQQNTPEVRPGVDIVLEDLILTVPEGIRRQEDGRLAGCGLVISGGREHDASLDFPPKRDDKLYSAKLFYQVDSEERWMETILSCKGSDLQLARSRLGLSAWLIVCTYRIGGAYDAFDISSFSTRGGLRVFIEEAIRRELRGDAVWFLHVFSRREGKPHGYEVLIRQEDPGHETTSSKDLVMSIAASLRLNRPATD